MQKRIWIAGIALALGAIVFLGVRDIRRLGSQLTPESSSAAADSNSSRGEGAAGADLPTIKFVRDPQPMPRFTLKDLDGNTISSDDWRGKVVLVNFWATWCPPCREEIPDLIKLQEKYEGKLLIVGLSDDSGPVEGVREFVRQAGINYPVAIANSEIEAKFGGVMGLPTSFVIDTQGRVVQKHIGLRDPQLYDLEIRALLQLPVEAKVETFTDTGQVFLSNAKNATELPGVDLSRLSPAQRKLALRRLNETNCTCPCGMTLAQCRINDSSCPVSQEMAAQVVQAIGNR